MKKNQLQENMGYRRGETIPIGYCLLVTINTSEILNLNF